MSKRVAHIIRKLLPPFVSFIRNQIMNHVRYDAYVIYKEHVESDFAREIIDSVPTFCCDGNRRSISKGYSKLLYGKPFRRLTGFDKRNIVAYLRKNDIDVIHFHYGTDAGVFIDITKYVRIPSIVSFYGYDCSSFPKWYFGYGKNYLKKVFASANLCLAMSLDMKRDLLSIGCPEDKIRIHYYGTDVQKFRYTRKYRDDPNVILIIVASLEPQKGHMFLLQAFGKAVSLLKNKTLRMVIVGDGPLRSDLELYVRSSHFAKMVTFVGSLKYLSADLLSQLHEADIFVHPSVISKKYEKEGIPGAIIEAMAAGLPVISTYHAGIPYVIRNDETGVLVNEHDVDELTRAIIRLVDNPKLRRVMGRKAQNYVLKKLDLHNKERELEHIYDSVVEKHLISNA